MTTSRLSLLYDDQALVDFVAASYSDALADAVEAVLKGDPSNSTQYARFVRRSLRREIAWKETK